MAPRQAIALASLLLVILVLTGSVAGTTPRSPILGGLAPILALTFMTWYLIVLIVNRNDIITALAAILLLRRKEKEPKTNFLLTIVVYAILIGVVLLVLWSGLPQRVLKGLQGIAMMPGTGSAISPPLQIIPIPNLLPTTPIMYYGMLVTAAVFIVSVFILLRGVRMALAERRSIAEEHEGEIELKQEAIEAVQQTIARLRVSREYHETILQCYQRMCKILSEAGLVISPAETAREFAESISTRLRIGRDAVRDLTFLFEEARYSHHQINDEKRIAAVNHLESLQRALSGNVGLQA
mgnify:CR=1 FL=1